MSKNKEFAWLEGLDDAFARLARLHPKKIDLSLGRLQRVLAALGNPHERLPPIIHIAGTNGKGSTLAFLRRLIELSGQTCHIYTSPHLVRFNERIVVAGKEITNEAMTAAVLQVEEANQNQPLTFFEAMTAATFLVFSERAADFCLLETGLGGRYDATNVVQNPIATIISSIDYDHQAFLGDTLTQIAFEKAGIIKSQCPVVVAPQEAQTLAVLEKTAQEKQSTLFYNDRDWGVEKTAQGWIYKDRAHRYVLPMPNLAGEHQLENASTALFTAHLLELPLDKKQIEHALTSCRWRARLQKISIKGREVYLDGGHNAEAGKALAHFLASKEPPRYLICAMRATKAAEEFLAPFRGTLEGLIALDLPATAAVPGEGAKAYLAAELKTIAEGQNIKAEVAASLDAALAAIPQQPQQPSLSQPQILIAGSLLLAGDVLKRFL